jgi:hypothetical protein
MSCATKSNLFTYFSDLSSNPNILVEVFAEGMVSKTRVG